ncbi:hypothetical protein I2I11_13870 [Pontibacter sp. 172403-2]|uniref:hypothetical protein n=1 Tax=Pontibacter rufus TaxID=2791028 RepID=UPI0018AFD7FB|nr:hypothetical protein [Pontibacter sp. 172403-2]MBF9254388.1 hypothetical protein [Pontibacter sp. 172403-2]
MKKSFLLVPLIVLCMGCANDPIEVQTNGNHSDRVVESESLDDDISKAQSDEQKDVLVEFKLLKQQVANGDYSQIDDFISQIQSYEAKQPSQMTAEEKLSFPQLTKDDLIDFLKSVDIDSLKHNGSFDKRYSFHSAPSEYEPDSEECPDMLQLSIDRENEGFSLLQNNSFLVDETIGCAESSTVYCFTAENGKLLLKKVDYAG